MASIKDTGVTLRRLDFSESSQVMVFFTRAHGKVRAIGKGIKRSTRTRFAVGIDLLEVGDMVLSVRQARQEALATLVEWKAQRALAGLRERLGRLYAAQYAAETTTALLEDWDPHPLLFDGLLTLLDGLCTAEAVLPPTVAYQALLLHQVGAWPEFAVCVACRRTPATEGDLYFSSHEGGLLCRDCEAGHPERRLVDRRGLPLLSGSESPEDAVTTRVPGEGSIVEGVFSLLNYHLAHQMGREPLLACKLVSR
ncbi:MAG: DNA repair protein RecO [bacterium]|nr:DNA repair protein RecO [bacterium]